MKNNLPLISRFAAVALAAGGLCCGNTAFGQLTPPDTKPEPGKVGSMSAVGQKPSKAEMAKQKEGASTSTTTTAAAPVANQMAGAAMADMDKQFIQTAAKDGMKEVHMGQMAAKDGQSDEVKKLGSKIVTDHTKANNQLMAIAEKKGMKLDLRHKMDKMSKKDMENFDQAWLAMMVNDHNKDIAAFDKQAKMGTDPELKAFAKKTLPVLQSHLKMVKAAQSKMMAKKSS